jgi:hypothetical protein
MSYSGASVSVPRLSSEFGSGRAGWGPKGNIVREDIPITSNAVDAVITVPAAQSGTISIQFNNADGSPIAHAQRFKLYALLNATPTGLAATGGSTGIAIGANGFIAATQTAKKIFECFTDSAGLFKATWTDNAAETAFLGVLMPSGRLIVSAQLPTA